MLPSMLLDKLQGGPLLPFGDAAEARLFKIGAVSLIRVRFINPLMQRTLPP